MATAKDESLLTRATLIERLKDWKDDSSWQEFFDLYSQMIRGVATKSGLTDSEAEDVLQETMMAVAKHITTFKYDRKVGSFKHWLLNMSRWRISDQFRLRKNLTTALLPEDLSAETKLSIQIDDQNVNFDEFWHAQWQQCVMDAAMKTVKKQLPDKYQIFDFVVNKRWSAEKVAATFNITVNQVYLARHRVMDLIKKEVERLKSTDL
jgi:RNA polymerase sigma factor (sigma-70 family)